MADRNLQITITGVDKGGKKVFGEVDKAANATQSKIKQLSNSISNEMAFAAGAITVAVGVALKGAFDAAVESQRVSRETERVITTTGAASWTTAAQIGNLSQSISELTGADDELVQSAANLLLTFTNIQNRVGENNDVFDQAVGYALDLSAVMGTDAKSAAVMLGKALNDPITGMGKLTKAGVTFSEQQKDQIRTLAESGDALGAQKIILAELGKEFGGAAATAQTPLDQLKVKIGNLQEELGAQLIPVVSKAASAVTFLAESFSAMPSGVQIGIVALGTFVTAGAGIITLVAKLSDVFAPLFGAISRGFASAQQAIYGFTANLTHSSQIASTVATALTTGLAAALGVATIAMIGFSFYQRAQAEDAKEAAKGQDAYAEAIAKTTGSLSDNVKIATAKLLTDKKISDNLDGTSAKLELLGDALANSGDSFEKYRDAFKESQEEGFNASSDLFFRTSSSADALVGKLREMASEGDVVAKEMIRLKDSGELNNNEIKDLVLTFDDLQDQYENATTKGSATERVFNGMAGASKNAAMATEQQIERLKELSDELRAQTDPWFAAFKAQGDATKAQDALNVAVRDYGPSSKQAQDAAIANAQAAVAFKGDLFDLKKAQTDGSGSAEFLKQLEGLKDYGFDPTSQAAKNMAYDILGVGAAADRVDGKSVWVDVNLDMKQAYARLDYLNKMKDPVTGYISLGDVFIASQMFAKGGQVQDGPFIVGEQGPELGYKSGSTVRIFSNPESSRMLEPMTTNTRGGDTVNVYVTNSNASAYDIGKEVLWSRKVAG